MIHFRYNSSTITCGIIMSAGADGLQRISSRSIYGSLVNGPVNSPVSMYDRGQVRF